MDEPEVPPATGSAPEAAGTATDGGASAASTAASPSAATNAAPAGPTFVPHVTIALIALNVLVFGIEVASGASAWLPTPLEMIDLGGNEPGRTLGGEPWRLATAMFLHYGVLHLAMNMIGLWSGGAATERMYGRARFAGLYLVAGLAGGLATASFKTNVVSAGASGAVFGVFGMFGAFLLAHRERFDRAVIEAQARGLGVFLFYNLIYGVTQPSVDMTAHLGGLAAGFVLGLALEAGRAPGGRRPARDVAVLAIAVGALALGVATKAPPPPSVQAQAYAELDRVEKATLAAAQQRLAALDAGQTTAAEVADFLEREVAPAWQGLTTRLEALPAPPARLTELHAAILGYCAARNTHWRALVDSLRGKVEGNAAVEEADRAVGAALERIKAALAARD